VGPGAERLEELHQIARTESNWAWIMREHSPVGAVRQERGCVILRSSGAVDERAVLAAKTVDLKDPMKVAGTNGPQ
jgi:hypothetical protein